MFHDCRWCQFLTGLSARVNSEMEKPSDPDAKFKLVVVNEESSDNSCAAKKR